MKLPIAASCEASKIKKQSPSITHIPIDSGLYDNLWVGELSQFSKRMTSKDWLGELGGIYPVAGGGDFFPIKMHLQFLPFFNNNQNKSFDGGVGK
ncbi:MAG: hypothetical protein KJ600_01950 [Nanoarchaeota archaeon]|nr:hypothetical protein [Nanoarchaeota archaeon]